MSTQLLRRRLESHGLMRARASSAVEVVHRLLALQAQDLVAAKWGIGVRASGATEKDVDAALTSGAIVRSWPMRGTLHIVPAQELDWMQSLTAPRILASAQGRHRQLELTEKDIARAREVAEKELAGGRARTRTELQRCWEAKRISTRGQRGYHLIWTLALTGTLCWGPVVGREQALVLTREWIRAPRTLVRDEALGELVVRYLAGHGPATMDDLSWWSGLTKTDTKLGFSIAAPKLERLGKESPYWCLASSERTKAAMPALALPAFDEYLLGYTVRSPVIDDADFMRVVPGKNGVFQAILVAGGRIVGTWKRRLEKNRLTVAMLPFGKLSPALRSSLARAIRSYGDFLGVDVVG